MNRYNLIFKQGIIYKPTRVVKNHTNYLVHEYLMDNNVITRDIFNSLGVTSVDCKVKKINELGKFILTPITRDKWYIKR